MIYYLYEGEICQPLEISRLTNTSRLTRQYPTLEANWEFNEHC